jgi:hypothetical protein
LIDHGWREWGRIEADSSTTQDLPFDALIRFREPSVRGEIHGAVWCRLAAHGYHGKDIYISRTPNLARLLQPSLLLPGWLTLIQFLLGWMLWLCAGWVSFMCMYKFRAGWGQWIDPWPLLPSAIFFCHALMLLFFFCKFSVMGLAASSSSAIFL